MKAAAGWQRSYEQVRGGVEAKGEKGSREITVTLVLNVGTGSDCVRFTRDLTF